MADEPDEPQGRALFSHDEHGTIVDAWIWEELLGEDETPKDAYFHDVSVDADTE